jgi:hypothetical protein
MKLTLTHPDLILSDQIDSGGADQDRYIRGADSKHRSGYPSISAKASDDDYCTIFLNLPSTSPYTLSSNLCFLACQWLSD